MSRLIRAANAVLCFAGGFALPAQD